MTAAQMLEVYQAEIDRFGIAPWRKDYVVHLIASPTPASRKPLKTVFRSKSRSACVAWREHIAMEAVKKAMQEC